MERTVSATEARIHFGEMMRRVVEDEEAVIVERDGKPQIVLVSVAEYRQWMRLREELEPAWQGLVRQAHEAVERDLAGTPLPPAEDIIRQMREERDAYANDLH